MRLAEVVDGEATREARVPSLMRTAAAPASRAVRVLAGLVERELMRVVLEKADALSAGSFSASVVLPSPEKPASPIS